jgi:hypothetical protein
VRVSGTGTLTSTSQAALIGTGSVTVTTQSDLVRIDAGGQVSLAGPILIDFGSSNFTVGGHMLLASGTVATTGTDPLLQLGNTTVNVTGDLVRVASSGTLTSAGSLLSAGGSVNVAGDVVRATGDRIILAGAAQPLLSFNGGSHSLATASGSSVFNLTGANTTTETDADALGLTVGTDRPIHAGSRATPAPLADALLSTSSGATIGAATDSQQIVKLDTALLEASAPLLRLSAGGPNALKVANDAINLAQNAKLVANVPGDALVKLNNSALTIANGSLVNVANGSFMKITGSLLSLDNGSSLTLGNGALVTVSGTSVFTLTGGSLALFGSNGTNTLSIAATPAASCPGCTLDTAIPNLLGVPVFRSTTSTVTVNPGFVPFSGGSPSLGAGAAVLVVAGNAKVKLSP